MSLRPDQSESVIREVLIASTDIIQPGDEPYVGWSQVLAERIDAALRAAFDEGEQ